DGGVGMGRNHHRCTGVTAVACIDARLGADQLQRAVDDQAGVAAVLAFDVGAFGNVHGGAVGCRRHALGNAGKGVFAQKCIHAAGQLRMGEGHVVAVDVAGEVVVDVDR